MLVAEFAFAQGSFQKLPLVGDGAVRYPHGCAPACRIGGKNRLCPFIEVRFRENFLHHSVVDAFGAAIFPPVFADRFRRHQTVGAKRFFGRRRFNRGVEATHGVKHQTAYRLRILRGIDGGKLGAAAPANQIDMGRRAAFQNEIDDGIDDVR